MSTIIRENYPVARLPKDIQDEVGDSKVVRLTIESVEEGRKVPVLEDIFAHVRRLQAEGKIQPVSAKQVVERVRALRDEWDD